MNGFLDIRKRLAPRSSRSANAALGALLLCSAASFFPQWSWCATPQQTQQTQQIQSAQQTQQAGQARTPTPVPSATATAAPTAVRRSPDLPPAGPPPGDSIGAIEGAAIAITGPMSVEVVNGQVKTVLRSGSDVRVKSGTARIDLVEGGLITICGPAHLSILKAGGAITVALDSGTIHAHLGQSPVLTVYTAQIKAQPLGIGDAALDLLVGFDSPGVMCVRAAKGAVRLEQQLSGQSLVIPQTGDVLVSNGQLESLQTSSGRCQCELAPLNGPGDSQTGPPAEPAPQISQLATGEDLRRTEEQRQKTFDTKPNLPAQKTEQVTAPREEPIYQVIVPPLVYMANAKEQPQFDPAMIILVRRVRVRPTVIFQGRVLEEATNRAPNVASGVAAMTPSTAAPPGTAAKPAGTSKPPADPSLVDRVKTFIQKLWTPSS